MTRMQEQKNELLATALKSVKQLRHLTGNNEQVTEVQKALEELQVVL